MQSGEQFDSREILPESLRGFLTFTEIDHSDFLIAGVSMRKLGHARACHRIRTSSAPCWPMFMHQARTDNSKVV